MLTDDDKKMARQHAMSKMDEWVHAREMQDYEQKVLDDAREKWQKEDSKTNVLYDVHKAIKIAFLLGGGGAVLLLKRFVMDGTYDWTVPCYGFICLAILGLIGLSFALHGESDPDFSKCRNRRKGARRLSVAVMIGAILFFAVPSGYVHCPYTHAVEKLGVSRYEFEKLDDAEAERSRESVRKKSHWPQQPIMPLAYANASVRRREYKDEKGYLRYLFWIFTGLSIVGFDSSFRLRDSQKD